MRYFPAAFFVLAFVSSLSRAVNPVPVPWPVGSTPRHDELFKDTYEQLSSRRVDA